MNKSITHVCVASNRVQADEVRYAHSLALLLSVPLLIAVPTRHPDALAFSVLHGVNEENILDRAVFEVEEILIEFDLRFTAVTAIPFDGTAVDLEKAAPLGTLFVSGAFASGLRAVRVIDPQFEVGFSRDNRKNILVALGNESDAAATALHALSDVERLLSDGGHVILYHTTWRNMAVVSDDPIDHICQEALDVLVEAKGRLGLGGVPFEVAVETAPTVVEGIAGAALGHHASLVIIARDRNAMFGDYADQLLDLMRGSVPILVLPAKEELNA